MREHDYAVGDYVYVYSTSLNEVIYGRIEGFAEEEKTRIKLLQKLPDGILRHVVSWVYVFRSKEEAISCQCEHLDTSSSNKDTSLSPGVVVHLIQNGEIIRDDEGNPYNYQVTTVYRKTKEVSLVTAYGESVGRYNWKDVIFSSNEPLFRSTDYDIGQRVTWLEGDDVYEGIITKLRTNTAEVMNIKKLLPITAKRSIPYYKIPSDSQEDNTSKILATLIGDDLEIKGER